MKRNAILLAMFSIMALWLSGCITSHSPSATAVTIKVGDSQTFTVSGIANGPYTWSNKGIVVIGNTTASYTYSAVLEDVAVGPFSVKVSTKDSFNVTNEFVWTVTVVNDLPPTANAGPDQPTIHFGDPVFLDGSASNDPESQPLNYVWEIVGRPAGSSCSLSDPTVVKPSFTPDVNGVYTVVLIVNDGRLTSEPDTVIISTTYQAPTANAGPDQSFVFPGTVSLDGSSSTNPESSPLTYKWAIDSGPAGSIAALDNSTKAKPKFTPDKKGVYVCSLVVNNGVFDSGIDYVTIIVYNNPPVANAGVDITVAVLGSTAHLDGSASADPDGQALIYSWTILSRPYGSTAALNNPSTVDPTLTPDKKGAYLIQLVVSDGDLTSNIDQVIITCSNQVPVADAGAPIIVDFLNTAQLNGSATDPDGDPMTYAWTLVSKPEGSVAVLSSTTILNPTFTPDVQGSYQFALVATDNTGLSSSPSTVAVSTGNHQPVANAGDDIIMSANTSVALNGSGTDADSDPLTFKWRVITAPMGSGGDSTISDLNIAKPDFTPDIKGDYVLGLIVNDGYVNSVEDTMKIHVLNNQPVANAGSNQNGHVIYGSNLVFNLNGSASSDPDGDSLTYRWRVLSKPAGSLATLSSTSIYDPTLTLIDFPGAYVVGLTVNDGAIDSAESTVTLTFVNNPPVANAGTNKSQHTAFGVPNVFNLDGGGSSDLDSDSLSYTWRVISKPSGSTATLSSTTIVNPTITADKLGAYVIGLIVNDGYVNSAESQVTLTYTNVTPTAVAGTYANVLYANRGNVALNGGSSTDLDSDPLTYAWTMTVKPTGSTAVLNNASTQTPWFAMDLPGTYTITLTVNDGFATSAVSTTSVLNSTATITDGFENGGNLGTWFKNTGSTAANATASAYTTSPQAGTYSMQITATSVVANTWYEEDKPINTYLISATIYTKQSSTSSMTAALYLDGVINGANFSTSTSWTSNSRTGINKYVTNFGIRATWTSTTVRQHYTDTITLTVWN